MRPRARWVVRADDHDGCWRMRAPRPWSDDEHLGLMRDPGPAALLAAFDLPIGVPQAWARRAGVAAFRDVLAHMADGSWPRFHVPAESPAQVSLARPFYPRRPGGTRRDHLVQGLGLKSPDDLLRQCDRPVPGVIGAAAPVFWLVGAQQVGKAALTAWNDVLVPAAPWPHVRLWPMDGPLASLMAPGATVIAESYPRAAYAWPLGFPRTGWSKRSQADRRDRARDARGWLATSGISVDIDPGMDAALADGFGPAPSGEDPFDATMGAIQAIAVLEGLIPDAPPGIPQPVRDIEGWILGRPVG